MKGLVLWSFILLTVCHVVTTKSIIEKRNICTSSGCNPCDGQSCNSCNNNNVCCSSVSCNQCVNQCSSNCNTAACKNNCVSGCTNTCQSQTCPVQSCSQCVNSCSNQCTTNQCVNSCSNKCNDDCREKIVQPPEPLVIEPPQPSNVIVNNSNVNLVNLTTHININNVIHNINNISIPVFVNTTNINNINLPSKSDDRTIIVRNNSVVMPDPQPYPYPYPFPFPLPQPQPISDNCCYIMQPRRCYTDDDGSMRCFIRRQRECSDYCSYIRRDCGQCRTCIGNDNPSDCFIQNGCSNICRNSAPNCVPSQSGLQCY